MEVRLCVLVLVVCWCGAAAAKKNLEEEEYGVRYATDCEVCKLVTKEVGERLQAKDSSGVIETGYNMDAKKKKTKYNKSELRLVETLEEVCSQAVRKQQCLSEPYGEDVESPPPPPKGQGGKGDTARTAADREDL